MQRLIQRRSWIIALLGLTATAYGSPIPVIYYSQNFNSLVQNSPLAGQDGWTSLNAGDGTLKVDSSSFLVTAGTTNTQIKKDFGSSYLPGTNEIDIHLLMTPQTTLESTDFYIWLGNGGTEARWRFGDDWSKVSGSVTTSDQQYTTGGPGAGALGIQNDLDIKILITSATTATAQLFVNGVPNLVGGVNVPLAADMLAGGLKTLRMELLGNSGQSIRIDDLQVGTVPEPMTLTLLALGAVPMLMRRRRAA